MNKQNCKDGFRICLKCKTEKPLTREFYYRDKNRYGGFMYRCIECDKKRIDPRTYKERFAKLSDAQKERIKKHKSNYAKGRMGRAIALLKAYQNFDKERGYENDLTRFDIFSAREKECVYCGFPATGLDRKDNSKGHTYENCVPCCMECNVARMDNFTFEETKKIGIVVNEIKSLRIFKEYGICQH